VYGSFYGMPCRRVNCGDYVFHVIIFDDSVQMTSLLMRKLLSI